MLHRSKNRDVTHPYAIRAPKPRLLSRSLSIGPPKNHCRRRCRGCVGGGGSLFSVVEDGGVVAVDGNSAPSALLCTENPNLRLWTEHLETIGPCAARALVRTAAKTTGETSIRPTVTRYKKGEDERQISAEFGNSFGVEGSLNAYCTTIQSRTNHSLGLPLWKGMQRCLGCGRLTYTEEF